MNWRLYWNQIVSIIWKELLATFKDPKTRIILLLPVIIQGFLFGYAATYNLNKVPYVLIDESHTQTAAALESTINSCELSGYNRTTNRLQQGYYGGYHTSGF